MSQGDRDWDYVLPVLGRSAGPAAEGQKTGFAPHRETGWAEAQEMQLRVLFHHPAAAADANRVTLVYIEDKDNHARALASDLRRAVASLPFPPDFLYPFEVLWLMPNLATSEKDNPAAVAAVRSALARLDARGVLLDLSWCPAEEPAHTQYIERLSETSRKDPLGRPQDNGPQATSGFRLLGPPRERSYGIMVYTQRATPGDVLGLLKLGADAVLYKPLLGGGGEAHGLEVLERLLAVARGFAGTLPLAGVEARGGFVITPRLDGVWRDAESALAGGACLLLPGPAGAGRQSLFRSLLQYRKEPSVPVVLPLDRPVDLTTGRDSWLGRIAGLIGTWVRSDLGIGPRPGGLLLRLGGPWLNPRYEGWGLFRDVFQPMAPLPLAALPPPCPEHLIDREQLARLGRGLNPWQPEHYAIVTLPGLRARAYPHETPGFPPVEDEIWPIAEFLYWRALMPSGRTPGLVSLPLLRLMTLRAERGFILNDLWLNQHWEGGVTELAGFMGLLASRWEGGRDGLREIYYQHQRLWHLEREDPIQAQPVARAAAEAQVAVLQGHDGLGVLARVWQALDGICAPGDDRCIEVSLRNPPGLWRATGRLLHAPGEAIDLPAVANALEPHVHRAGWEEVLQRIEATIILRALQHSEGVQSRAAEQLGLSLAKWRTGYAKAVEHARALTRSVGLPEAARLLGLQPGFLAQILGADADR